VLDLSNVSRSYGGVRAVDDVTLTVTKGQRLAITGANGAGKTTLLRLIAGYVRPTAGTIRFDNAAVTRLPAYARARLGVRATHQQPVLLDRHTAAANVTLALLRRCGLTRRVLPWGFQDGRIGGLTRDLLTEHGLADVADVPAGQLTHGQRRRLELALALSPGCRLLLLDEPTAGLTPQARDHPLTALQGLSEDKTVVLVDHDPAVVDAVADTVVELAHGHVTETRMRTVP